MLDTRRWPGIVTEYAADQLLAMTDALLRVREAVPRLQGPARRRRASRHQSDRHP